MRYCNHITGVVYCQFDKRSERPLNSSLTIKSSIAYSRVAVERSDCRDPKTLAEAPAAIPSAGALRRQRSEGYLWWAADLGDPKGTLKSAQIRDRKTLAEAPHEKLA